MMDDRSAGGMERNLDFGFPRCYGRDYPDPSPDWTGTAYNSDGYCPPWKAVSPPIHPFIHLATILCLDFLSDRSLSLSG